MAVSCSVWSLREFFFNQNDKSARITVVCKGKCFCIQVSPKNFYQSPNLLEQYNRLMDWICNDEDYEKAEMAEDDLQQWAVNPFLPIFNQVESSLLDRQHFTLQDYLSPETYRFLLYVVNGQEEPRFDYEVPRQPRLSGVDLNGLTLYWEWQIFRPSEIEICIGHHEEGFSKFPTKVIAGGNMCFYKPLDYDDKRSAIREINIFKRMETLGISKTVHATRLYGVIQDEQSSRVVGLLLSWINCENKTLECALGPETPAALRVKWGQQVSTTLACLHEAGIAWGDAKAANILVDMDDNAWIIDFGSGYTRGWVEKDHMETIEGDQEGLSKIKELLNQKMPVI